MGNAVLLGLEYILMQYTVYPQVENKRQEYYILEYKFQNTAKTATAKHSNLLTNKVTTVFRNVCTQKMTSRENLKR